MANISSINGNPIVIDASSIEDDTITDAKLLQTGGVLERVYDLEDGRMTSRNLGVFSIGSISNGVFNGAVRYRVATREMLTADEAFTLMADSGFKFGVHVFVNGSFSEESGWVTKADISAGETFKLVLARYTEDTSETADIEELTDAVTYKVRFMEAIEQRLDLCLTKPELRNGSVYNPQNANGVAQRYILPRNGAKSVTVTTNFIPEDGYYLAWGVTTFNVDNGNSFVSFSDSRKIFSYDPAGVGSSCEYVFALDSEKGFAFELFQKTGNGQTMLPIRIADIGIDAFTITYNYGTPRNVKNKRWITSAHQGYGYPTITRPKGNTLAAFYLASVMGADMIEVDVRPTSDGILVCNHDETATGTNSDGGTVTYTVSETTFETLQTIKLSEDDYFGVQRVPMFSQVLNIAYNTGMLVNADLSMSIGYVEQVANMVRSCGMASKVVYALQGKGAQAVETILAIDPNAKFIDKLANITQEMKNLVDGDASRFYAYTGTFTDAEIANIRDSGCMLAAIGLNMANSEAAFAYHPEMCEFPHTSNFKVIESRHFDSLEYF